MASSPTSRRLINWVIRGRLMLGLACVPAAGSAWAADNITIRADSPQSYTVVRGDTLWDIAGEFLEEPWMWPEVWEINPQIANPDLIYPGDVIELRYVDGQLMLSLNRGAAAITAVPGLRTIRLSPQVRRTALAGAIPAISLEQISTHLSENSVVRRDVFESSPYVLTEREGRAMASQGDEILARGSWTPGVLSYDVVREGRNLIDPDTGDLLGVEAILVATATINLGNAEQAVLGITKSLQEVRTGDRLIPRQSIAIDSSYLPRPPAFDMDAAVIGIDSDQSIGGRFDTLILNAGQNQGLATGNLLTVQQPAMEVEDELQKAGFWQKTGHVFGFNDSHKAIFPGKNVASVLIYRVFDDTSFGIILESSDVVRLNDRAVTP